MGKTEFLTVFKNKQQKPEQPTVIQKVFLVLKAH